MLSSLSGCRSLTSRRRNRITAVRRSEERLPDHCGVWGAGLRSVVTRVEVVTFANYSRCDEVAAGIGLLIHPAGVGYRSDVPHDERKTQHEIGNRTYMVADVEPVDPDGIRTVQVGAALWVIAFRRPAALLWPASRFGSGVVAVDLLGRLRPRPVRLRVGPQTAQSTYAAPTPPLTGPAPPGRRHKQR